MDLDFISGNFLYEELPRDKEYLAKYFDGPVEKRFLVYYLTFSSLHTKKEDFLTFYENFVNHTGHACSTRWVRKLVKRLATIEEELQAASKSFDLDKVGLIKSGNFKAL